jgi:hypothetical protein
MVSLIQREAAEKENNTINLIHRMVRGGEKVTVNGLASRTGYSRSFLYANQKIMEAVHQARGEQRPARTQESKDTIIRSLKRRVRELEAENARLIEENGESYKEKFEREHEKVLDLSEQLRNSYHY